MAPRKFALPDYDSVNHRAKKRKRLSDQHGATYQTKKRKRSPEQSGVSTRPPNKRYIAWPPFERKGMFRFKDLPAEVRNLLYEHVLEADKGCA
jgi:hypothetical protein